MLLNLTQTPMQTTPLGLQPASHLADRCRAHPGINGLMEQLGRLHEIRCRIQHGVTVSLRKQLAAETVQICTDELVGTFNCRCRTQYFVP